MTDKDSLFQNLVNNDLEYNLTSSEEDTDHKRKTKSNKIRKDCCKDCGKSMKDFGNFPLNERKKETERRKSSWRYMNLKNEVERKDSLDYRVKSENTIKKGTSSTCRNCTNLKKNENWLKNNSLPKMASVVKKTQDQVNNPTEKDVKKTAERLEEYKKKQERADIEKKSQETIYRWKGSPKHQIGWILFFILVPLGFRKYFKLKNKKVKINNSFDEIKSKFESWRLNIYGSLSFYVIFFVLTEQVLTKFRPWLEKFVNNHQIFAFWFTALLLGILLVIDGFISSNLKTNLQRLSFSVEKTIDDKDLKKKIFFKTQDSTETLKENFKKFGMLAIPTMIVGILGAKWKKHWLSYGYYLIPVGYSFIRILEVNNVLKKLESVKTTNNDSP